MVKTIVYLIGKAGSGKTSAAKYLQEKHDFTSFTFSTAIREYATSHNMPLNERADYARAHTAILREHGVSYMVNMALALPGDRICLDGVRSRAYADLIKQGGGVSIAFDCPTEIRFSRVKNSSDTSKYPNTLNAFIQSEKDDETAIKGSGITFETDVLMREADYHIDASQSYESVLAQLDTTAQVILAQVNIATRHTKKLLL